LEQVSEYLCIALAGEAAVVAASRFFKHGQDPSKAILRQIGSHPFDAKLAPGCGEITRLYGVAERGKFLYEDACADSEVTVTLSARLKHTPNFVTQARLARSDLIAAMLSVVDERFFEEIYLAYSGGEDCQPFVVNPFDREGRRNIKE
jgi:hypothetical protein